MRDRTLIHRNIGKCLPDSFYARFSVMLALAANSVTKSTLDSAQVNLAQQAER